MSAIFERFGTLKSQEAVLIKRKFEIALISPIATIQAAKRCAKQIGVGVWISSWVAESFFNDIKEHVMEPFEHTQKI